MPKHESQAQRGSERRGGQTWRERKQRILTRGAPSITESIADAVVAKNGNLFFLAQPDGRMARGDSHGLGLYYHYCRFLKSYELKLAGAAPNGLASSVARGFMAVFQLTNPDINLKPTSMDMSR
jgi:hypothetical protein